MLQFYLWNVSSIDALKELKELKELTRLTALTLELGDDNSRSGSLDALKDLTQLTSLKLDNTRGMNVGSLDPIKELNGLISLTLLLSNSSLVDLSSTLQNCAKLQTLKIVNPLHYQFHVLPRSLRNLDLSDGHYPLG
jgi:hypothetical protein